MLIQKVIDLAGIRKLQVSTNSSETVPNIQSISYSITVQPIRETKQDTIDAH